MRKVFGFIVITFAIGFIPHMALAATAPDIMASLQVAREKLVTLTGATDKADQDELIEAIKKATKDVEDKLAGYLGNASTSADAKGKLTEFKSVWEQFK